jgi:pimeloyl-ACP methyl ester carboxylesterase
MAEFVRGDVSIHYEELGTGFPLLLLAPGGLNSTIDFWKRAAINPLVSLADDFHLIAMDQRNAGSSTGPFDLEDPWGSFVGDQLALVAHLGFDRFLVMGCCIGCSYALKIAEEAPEELVAAVLEQPIGLTSDNRASWTTSRQTWVSNLVATRPDLDEAIGESFGAKMWDDGEFVVSVTRDFVQSCPTPLLVLPGVDVIHPNEIGLEVAHLAPNATLVEPWKETPEQTAAATEQVREFLKAAVPDGH